MRCNMLIVRTYTNKRNKLALRLHSVEVIHNNKVLSFYPKLCDKGLKELLKHYNHSLVRHVVVANSNELNIKDTVIVDN